MRFENTFKLVFFFKPEILSKFKNRDVYRLGRLSCSSGHPARQEHRRTWSFEHHVQGTLH